MNEVLLTVDEAARRLALGRTAVYRLIMTGELVSIKVGGSRRVPAKALAEFVERRLEQIANHGNAR